MKLLIINPPHPSIGSRIPQEHLPPLGLLSLGGPLIDAGHEVKLLDAEFGPMPLKDIVEAAQTLRTGGGFAGPFGFNLRASQRDAYRTRPKSRLTGHMDHLRGSVPDLPLA